MSRPVYLYEFSHNANTIRRAASPRDVLAGGHLWTASSIGHSEVELNGDPERDSVKITLPITDSYFGPFLRNRQDGAVLLSIIKHDRDGGMSELEWDGRLTAPSASGGELTLRFEPETTGLVSGNRPRIFMRPCPHAVYYGECRLSRNNFRVTSALVSVSGAVVEVAASGDFAGGIIEASDGSTRTVKSQSGNVMTLVRPLPMLSRDMSEGATISLFPGCDRSPERCAEFPNSDNPSGTNIENYGGFLWMLTGGKNPFGGSSSV